MIRSLALGAAAALAACSTASTPPMEVGYAPGSLGYAAIVNGDLTAAETQLKTGSVSRDDPARLLNLAHVYQMTGRSVQAAQLYRQVLAGNADPMLELASGEPARAKRLASSGLERTEPQMAARID